MKRRIFTVSLLILILSIIAVNAFGDDPPTPVPPVALAPAPTVAPTPVPTTSATPTPAIIPAPSLGPRIIVQFGGKMSTWNGPQTTDSASVIMEDSLQEIQYTDPYDVNARIQSMHRDSLATFASAVRTTAEAYASSHTSHRIEHVPSQTTVVVRQVPQLVRCQHNMQFKCISGRPFYRCCRCGHTISQSDYHHHLH